MEAAMDGRGQDLARQLGRDYEIEALERQVRDLWTRVLMLEDTLTQRAVPWGGGTRATVAVATRPETPPG
jgi:hypothetical protein